MALLGQHLGLQEGGTANVSTQHCDIIVVWECHEREGDFWQLPVDPGQWCLLPSAHYLPIPYSYYWFRGANWCKNGLRCGGEMNLFWTEGNWSPSELNGKWSPSELEGKSSIITTTVSSKGTFLCHSYMVLDQHNTIPIYYNSKLYNTMLTLKLKILSMTHNIIVSLTCSC